MYEKLEQALDAEGIVIDDLVVAVAGIRKGVADPVAIQALAGKVQALHGSSQAEFGVVAGYRNSAAEVADDSSKQQDAGVGDGTANTIDAQGSYGASPVTDTTASAESLTGSESAVVGVVATTAGNDLSKESLPGSGTAESSASTGTTAEAAE